MSRKPPNPQRDPINKMTPYKDSNGITRWRGPRPTDEKDTYIHKRRPPRPRSPRTKPQKPDAEAS